MRKVTKKKHRKAKTRTKINIRHFKGRGPERLTYEDVVAKLKLFFGENTFKKALKYLTPINIQKLIDLLNIEKSKNSSNMNNNDQITLILYPALTKFLEHMRYQDFMLRALIPYIVNSDSVLTPTRIKNILTLAKEDKLIEEFIQDLEVLKLGPVSSIDVPDLTSVSLPPPAALPPPPPASTPPPASASLPPPRQSPYKSPRTTKSPHKSNSPYKPPHRAKSPEPYIALGVARVTKRNPNAIIVDAKNVVNISRLKRDGQGRNNKKTRRHK
jgi:hypothetical protein